MLLDILTLMSLFETTVNKTTYKRCVNAAIREMRIGSRSTMPLLAQQVFQIHCLEKAMIKEKDTSLSEDFEDTSRLLKQITADIKEMNKDIKATSSAGKEINDKLLEIITHLKTLNSK